MGNDQSQPMVDENTPTVKLEARDLASVAKYIKEGKAKRIVVMTGAGLSTAAGIPDFRSPETGLYANLARLNLPSAESVFDMDYFRQNPDPFYLLAKELYPGNYSPTLSHVFLTLLAKKGLLAKLYTQNIDCLEREAGVPGELIMEAHGSFATQRCIDCKTPFPDHVMKEHVLSNRVPRCVKDECNGLVKPDIVFFGESLPPAFFPSLRRCETADLALVMGTSLTVHPFATLPDRVPDDCPRVLFNMEQVGSLGSRPDDVLSLGDCNVGICALADHLGWLDELKGMWRELVGEHEVARQMKGVQEMKAELLKEMRELTRRMGDMIVDPEDQDSQGKVSGEDESIALEGARERASSKVHEGTTSSGSAGTMRHETLHGAPTTLVTNLTKPDTDKKQQDLEVSQVGAQSAETETRASGDEALKAQNDAEASSFSVSARDDGLVAKAEVKEESAPEAKPGKDDSSKEGKQSKPSL